MMDSAVVSKRERLRDEDRDTGMPLKQRHDE